MSGLNLAGAGNELRQQRVLRRAVGILGLVLLVLIGASYAMASSTIGGIACRFVAQAVGVPDLASCTATALPATGLLGAGPYR